jgi:hypothetical protein
MSLIVGTYLRGGLPKSDRGISSVDTLFVVLLFYIQEVHQPSSEAAAEKVVTGLLATAQSKGNLSYPGPPVLDHLKRPLHYR